MATGDLLVTLDALKASYDSLNEAPVEIQITTGQWNGSGPYTYTVNATNVTANTKIKVQMDSTINNLTSDLSVTTGSGNIVLSTSSLPSGTVNVTIFFIGAQGDVTTQVLADVYSTSQTYSKSEAVAKADIVNNLTSTSTTAPLSANMGKALNDKLTNTTPTVTKTENIKSNSVVIAKKFGNIVSIYFDVYAVSDLSGYIDIASLAESPGNNVYFVMLDVNDNAKMARLTTNGVLQIHGTVANKNYMGTLTYVSQS